MSGPRRKKERSTILGRRDFLRRAGLGSAALGALPFLPGCGSSSSPGDRGPGDGMVEFRHGVASGDPSSHRVMLWTRVSGIASGSVAVDYAVWADPGLEQRVTGGTATTDAGRDYTVKAGAAGLQPGTTYYYRFTVGGVRSPVGRTRTAPQGATERLLDPHMKYVDLAQKGCLLLDVTPERLVGEHWYVDGIAEPGVEGESLGAAYAVAAGERHLVAAEQTTPRSDAPAPAP